MTAVIPPGLPVALGIAFAVLLDTLGQLIWKKAALLLPAEPSARAVASWVAGSPAVWLLLFVFAVQLVNWLWVLERAELSAAQPFTALSYVSVVVLSFWLYDEHVDATKLLGIALVLLGVSLVGAQALRRRKTS